MNCNIKFDNDVFLPNLQLRRLLQSDISVVQQLCKQWFPIDYPFEWYMEIATNPKFHALAAVVNNTLIGLLVAEIKPQEECNIEDQGLLSRKFPRSTKVAYILTLGVVSDYRRKGIATYLLKNFVNQLTCDNIKKDCKAIYLHVLSTNRVAINFYEKTNFFRHLYLPFYYYIDGKPRDGFSYVLYINGGFSPIFLLDPFAPIISLIADEINLSGLIFNLRKFFQKTITYLIRTVSNESSTNNQDKSQLLFC